MPPKINKGNKKGKNKKQTKILVDDVDTTLLNRKTLEQFCINVNDELIKEKQYSDFLRLERDKLVKLNSISMEQLKNIRHQNRQTSDEIRDVEEECRIELHLKRQKLKHLKNELESQYLNKKSDAKRIIGNEQECHKAVTLEIISDINELKKHMYQLESDYHQNKVKSEQEHAENIYRIKDEDKVIHNISENGREKCIKEQQNKLNIVFVNDKKALEVFKVKEYRRFVDNNTKTTIQLKHYYNRIVNHNQEVINFLKCNTQEIKDSTSKLDKKYSQLKEEKKQLTEDLNRMVLEKSTLEEKLVSSAAHKSELKETKEKLHKNKNELQNLTIEYDILVMINEKKNIMDVEKEEKLCNDLYALCSKTQKILLIKEFYLIHVLYSLNEVNGYLSKVKDIYKRKGKFNPILESVLEYEDTSLDVINYEIAKKAEEIKSLFRKYKERLKKFNIPFENTGFNLLGFEEILRNVDNSHMLMNDYSLLNIGVIEGYLLLEAKYYFALRNDGGTSSSE